MMQYSTIIAKMIPPRISCFPETLLTLTLTPIIIAPARIQITAEAPLRKRRKSQISLKYIAIRFAKSESGLSNSCRFNWFGYMSS